MKDYKEIAENVLKKRDEYLRIRKRRRSMIIKTVSSFTGVAAAACVSLAVYNNSTVHKIKPNFNSNPYNIIECTKPTSVISTEPKAEICTTAVNATEPHVDITTETVCTECTDTTAVNTTETSCTSAMTSQTTIGTAVESTLIPVSKTTSAVYEYPVTSISTVPCRTDLEIHQTTDLQTTAVQYTSLTTDVALTTTSSIVATYIPSTTVTCTYATLTTFTSTYFTTVLPYITSETGSTTVYTPTKYVYWTTTFEKTNVTSATFTTTETYTTSVTESTDLSTDEPIPVTDTTTYLYFATTAIYRFSYDTDDVSTTTYTTII